MKTITKRVLTTVIITVALLYGGKAGAQTEIIRSSQLPQAFRQLIPQGAIIYASETTKTPEYGTGTVTFAANETGKEGRFETTYLFELTIVTAQTIEGAEKWRTMYRKDLESKTANKMKEENSTVNCETDLPQLNEYPWGTGIIQRTLCMDSDGDTIRSEKYYECTYYGMCEDDGGLFKLFTLTVKYGEDPAKADDLAKRAAQLVSETTLGQL